MSAFADTMLSSFLAENEHPKAVEDGVPLRDDYVKPFVREEVPNYPLLKQILESKLTGKNKLVYGRPMTLNQLTASL